MIGLLRIYQLVSSDGCLSYYYAPHQRVCQIEGHDLQRRLSARMYMLRA